MERRNPAAEPQSLIPAPSEQHTAQAGLHTSERAISKRAGAGWDRLTIWRAGARAVLWAEWVMAHSWSQLCVLAAACGVAMLGLVPAGAAGPCLALLTTGAALAACARYERARPPRPNDVLAERRLERDSGLRHTPFAVLRDRPALLAAPGNAAALWAAHEAAARARLARLRLSAPRIAMAAHDPFALRVGALLLLVSGLIVAGDQANDRILHAFVPGFIGATGHPPIIQAWVTPPAYTGLPPIFLTREGMVAAPSDTPVEVPEGSHVSLSVSGGGRKPGLSLPGAEAPRVKFHGSGTASWQTTAPLTASGTLRVTRFPFTLGHWAIAIIPNTPPRAEFTATPGPAGKTTELKLPWHTAQRWGVASLEASLVPAGKPGLKPLRVPIPLAGTPKDEAGTLQTDLTANPYAGLPVIGRLTARDVSGQRGESAPQSFTLPERAFKNGLARAIIALRRRLVLEQESPADAANDLDALAQPPAQAAKPGAPASPAASEAIAGHAGLFLNIAAAAAFLREPIDAAGLDEVQQRLWIVALALDGGLPEESQLALDRARETLRHALKDRAAGKISENDLARAMQQLRQALDRRLQDLARKAAREGNLPKPPANTHYAVPSIDRMMRQLEQALREGRMEDAQQKLAQIEEMMRQLKNARVLTPQEAQAAREAQKQAKKQSGAVQDMVQREGGLMDSAQARAPRPPALPRGLYPDAPPPPPSADALEANEESREQDANTQRALKQSAGALKSMLGMGQKPPPSLDAATHDMQAAVDALKAGEEPQARVAESKAVDDLRKSGQEMQKQSQSGSGQMALIPGGDPGSEAEEQDAGGDSGEGGDAVKRDPLGRPLQQGTGGRASDDNSVHVPDAMEAGRSRAIQEELRRREADRARPQDELDYIGRLLKSY